MIIFIKQIILSNWLYIGVFTTLILCYGIEEINNWSRFNKIGTLIHYNKWKPSSDILFTAVFSIVTIIGFVKYLRMPTIRTMMVFLIHIMLFLRFSIRMIQRGQIFENGFKHLGKYYLWQAVTSYKWIDDSEEMCCKLELKIQGRRIKYEIGKNRVDNVNAILVNSCKEGIDSLVAEHSIDQAV